VLRPLVSANQSISATIGSNTLLVTDSADNLSRIERIIAAIDVPHGDDPQIIALKHASALDVAGNLNRLYASQPGANSAATGLTVIADQRGNRIIIRSDNPGQLARARALVADMDKADAGIGNIRVVFLKNAEAVKVAQTLRAILGAETGNSGASGGNTASQQPTAFSAPANASSNASSSAFSNSSSNSGQGALVPGSMIQADTASNALIITAAEPVYNNLRNVIEMLDRRRAQVYIEALVVELTADRAAEFGIQWQGLGGLNKSGNQVVGGTNFGGVGQNILSTAQNVGSVGAGLNIAVTRGQINIPGLGMVTNLGMLARFLETEARANILSTPNILTLDNEEAKIVIGQNLPFVTGSYSTVGNASTVTPFQTYERKDVGLTLKVRPLITEGGVVRVQIYQEASSVQAGTANSAAGPTTNKRSLESNVLVDDGNIIVLGGLIEDSYGLDQEKVPLLGDIPVLGNLFQYENRNRKKTNLMVFLRPHIVRDASDYRGLTSDRYDMLLGAQRKFGDDVRSWRDNGAETPILPTLPLLPKLTTETKALETAPPAAH
jgi:general secretion pathway protein D